MAKFRTNHAQGSRGSGGMIVRVGLFGAIVGGLYALFQFFGGESTDTPPVDPYSAEAYFLPKVPRGAELIEHRGFALAYDEEAEQALWVANILTRDNLSKDWYDRQDNFRPDPAVSTGSATPDDYRGSGYDRGHLVPAADLAFDSVALSESFYMSNISPQARNFNKGIWRELEELTRDWAKRCQRLYVVTGPVLTETPKGYIGENEVAIPVAYYKVLLDLDEPEQKAIAFLIPNQVSFEPLYEFATSVDEVEEVTGLDFFPELMPGDLEDQLEASFNLDLWEFSKQKFDQRINEWNQ
ncbi:MAG: DNA/RNA non-specific endonuclease [Lewinella sp.]|nr:DNA/RNA non-specific endonuclease [Lewinella sp.]